MPANRWLSRRARLFLVVSPFPVGKRGGTGGQIATDWRVGRLGSQWEKRDRAPVHPSPLRRQPMGVRAAACLRMAPAGNPNREK